MFFPNSEIILIVDDTPINLDVISDVLIDAGFEVAFATNGKMMLEQLQWQLPDLILLDVEMPIMNGFEICQKLKEIDVVREIPVIFMTALADAKSKAKGFELGAVDYITKPFQEAEVLARVATHLQLRRFTKSLEQQVAERTSGLEQASQQLEKYSQTLEQMVEDRTQELSKALATLQATQSELIHSEKMAVLGQLTASIAHEINTPLAVIRAATGNIATASSTSLQQLPQLMQSLSTQQQEEFLKLVNTSLQQTQTLSTKEERHLRRQLQSELTAQGIAEADSIAMQLSQMQLRVDLHLYQSILQAPNCCDILEVAYKLLMQRQSTLSIQQEVDRAAKIVFALKTYSHQSQNNEKSFVQISDGIEIALTLYQSRLKQGIEVIRKYDPVPNLFCDPDELTQVWVNLIDNAIYSIGQQGTLEISISQQSKYVVVEITDSGNGIPIEMQEKIFEPFVTSKPRGEGSGLGLDIVRQILQKHDGDIQVRSQIGRATFSVIIPLTEDRES